MKSEKELERKIQLELCDLKFDLGLMNILLNGPNYPENYNINSDDTNDQKFDLRIVMPDNLIEFYILREYLRDTYLIDD